MFSNVYPREKYLNRIRPFYHSDIIKVITGIRRCGKSFVLRAITNELTDSGIDSDSILYLPLDRRGFKYIKTPEQLEEKIESMLGEKDFYYLFIDEVQNVEGFESVVQAYAEEVFSLFLTYISKNSPTSISGGMNCHIGHGNTRTFVLVFPVFL